jgi:hypothetical protein
VPTQLHAAALLPPWPQYSTKIFRHTGCSIGCDLCIFSRPFCPQERIIQSVTATCSTNLGIGAIWTITDVILRQRTENEREHRKLASSNVLRDISPEVFSCCCCNTQPFTKCAFAWKVSLEKLVKRRKRHKRQMSRIVFADSGYADV